MHRRCTVARVPDRVLIVSGRRSVEVFDQGLGGSAHLLQAQRGLLGAAKGPKCLVVNTYEGLGRSTATPVLASAYVTSQGVTTPRAIAIIAGGKPPLDSTIQNAGVDGTGERAVWIVDMATGALIRKLTTDDMDLTGSTVTVSNKTKDLGYFWTEPACYDVAPGQLASRCFLGDSKGMVWRIDVSDANPSKWKLTFFHDAYSAADTPSSLVQNIKGKGRVPVLSPPVLSTDKDGSLVVVYGTGGLKDAAELSRRHIVFSVKEKLTLGANGVAAKIEAGALWMKVMTESTRYIGPPTIFSRNAYFSTYTISASGVCSTGTGRMWGHTTPGSRRRRIQRASLARFRAQRRTRARRA